MQPDKGVYTSPFTNVPGWHTEEEEIYLTHLAGTLTDASIIIELGAEYGRSAAAFCRGVDIAELNAVSIFSYDLFPRNHPLVGNLLIAYKNNLIEAGYKDKTQPIIGDSAIGSEDWEANNIDLLFVDAGHTFEEAFRDLVSWEIKIDMGGIVAIHDCLSLTPANPPHALHHEVEFAVDKWLEQSPFTWDELPRVGSIRSLKKVA